jgi:RNA-splicing ligase RtcB
LRRPEFDLSTLDGFPIGGVAAFDVDTGIISPGGIG